MKSFHRRSIRTAPRAAPSAPVASSRDDRVRADSLLVAQGLAVSRTAAARLIADGLVLVNDERVRKPSHLLPADAPISVIDDDEPHHHQTPGLSEGTETRTGTSSLNSSKLT